MCDKICKIEATVPTGFESTAREEASEYFDTPVEFGRGKVTLDVKFKELDKVKQLQSVDNVFVVLKTFNDFKFSDKLADALSSTIDLVGDIDWQHGLDVWRQFIDCDLTVSPTPVSDWKERLDNAKVRLQEQYTNGKTTQNSPTNQKGDSNSEQPPAKRQKLEQRPDMPSFRATCYRTGKGHVFESPQAAAVFGGAIQDYFQWNVKMKEFDIEVVLNIEETTVSVMIGLTKESMHRRHITKFGPTTLRPTIAYGMLRYCKIEDGDVVCDPMCGGGSIPIEAALNWPLSKHICGDYDDRAVTRSKENIAAINARRTEQKKVGIQLDPIRWDSTNLPLNTNSVDVFVSDLPFGKRSGSKMRNWSLYPKTLTDLARVSKVGTGRACLLTQDRKCMLKSLGSVKYWALASTVFVNIGGLSASLYILQRSQQLFEAVAAKTRKDSNKGKQPRDESKEDSKENSKQDSGA